MQRSSIVQKFDSSESADFVTCWLGLGDAIEKVLSRRLRPWRITLAELQLLQALDTPRQRQGELARQLERTAVAISRQVALLTELGYVHREADPADLRGKRLRLTAAGHRVRRQAEAALAYTLASMSEPMDATTCRTFKTLLTNLDALHVPPRRARRDD